MSSPVPGPSGTQNVRGRGRGRGRPRTRGGSTSRRSLPFAERETNEVISELDRVRQQRALTNKNIKKLSTEAKKQLESMKRTKELSRMLLPDAPPSKRKRANTPERTQPVMSGNMGASIYNTPSSRVSAVMPSSGGSLASHIDVPSLSPSFWHHGISVDLEIESCSPTGTPLDARQEVDIIDVHGNVDDAVYSASRDLEDLSDSPHLIHDVGDVVRDAEATQEVDIIDVHGNVGEAHASVISLYTASGDLIDPLDSPRFNDFCDEVRGADSDLDDMDGDAVDNVKQLPQVELPPAELPHNIAPGVRDFIESADAANDRTTRNLATEDMLTFNWKKEASTFKGVREKFIGTAGPTFSMEEMQHPIDFFRKIWDTDLIDQIVDETNRYADVTISGLDLTRRSRSRRWVPTTRQELLKFFSMLMFQSLIPLPVEKDFFKTTGIMAVPGIAKIMTYDRFIALKRFLHFADETNMPQQMTLTDKRLFKIQPLVDYLNDKFMTLYLPEQCIAIDESLLHWSGRLSFIQKISNKAAKVGLKSYELCESSTGYLWKFFIYGGADKNDRQRTDIEPQDGRGDRQHTDGETQDGQQTDREAQDGRADGQQTDRETQDERGDGQQTNRQQTDRQAASDTVEPDGATARIVYDLVTPLLGKGHTLVMDNFYNSPLLARCLKCKGCDVLGTLRLSREFVPNSLKSLSKSEMRVGEVAWSQTEDLTVFLWLDSNLVCFISTFHPVEVGAKEKYGKLKYKPQAILDYNVAMGGVDKKDQLLSAYPMERCRNQVWYKKLFRRLLNISILNAYIICKNKFPEMSQRSFRITLAEAILTSVLPSAPAVTEVKVLSVTNRRPLLSGNHFIARGSSKFAICVHCKSQGQRSRTSYICKQCNISLCLDFCFEMYHTAT